MMLHIIKKDTLSVKDKDNIKYELFKAKPVNGKTAPVTGCVRLSICCYKITIESRKKSHKVFYRTIFFILLQRRNGRAV